MKIFVAKISDLFLTTLCQLITLGCFATYFATGNEMFTLIGCIVLALSTAFLVFFSLSVMTSDGVPLEDLLEDEEEDD